jgi:hypothetical protein
MNWTQKMRLVEAERAAPQRRHPGKCGAFIRGLESAYCAEPVAAFANAASGKKPRQGERKQAYTDETDSETQGGGESAAPRPLLVNPTLPIV